MSDTTNELTNRMLAERAGWRVIENPEGRSATGTIPMDLWHNGVLMHTERASHAERYVIEMRAWEHIPDYLHDTDAALTLIAGDLRVSLHNEDYPLWTAVVGKWIDGYWEQIVGSAASPAEAVCRAWWAWMDAQEGQ